MRILCCILLLFSHLHGVSQVDTDIDEIYQTKFWQAKDSNDYAKIIEYGDVLIQYFDNEKMHLDTASLFVRLFTANAHSNQNEFQRALDLNIRTKDLIHTTWGDTNQWYSSVLNYIGNNYKDLSFYEKALDYFNEALDIKNITIGKSDPTYLTTLDNIISVHVEVMNYEEVLKYSIDKLQILETNNRDEEDDYINLRISIGHLFEYLGRSGESLDFNKETLLRVEKKEGNKSLLYAEVLNLIGLCYESITNYSESIKFHYEALSIKKFILGEENESVAYSLNNLADSYYFLGDHKKALRLNFEALAIKGVTLGLNSNSCATSLNQIGLNYTELEQYSRASEYYKQALEITENNIGQQNDTYLTYLNNLGLNYVHNKQHNEAEEVFLQCLALIEFDSNSPLYSALLNNIGFNYDEQGESTKAIEYYLLVLNSLDSVSANNRHYRWTLQNISRNQLKIGQFSKAQDNLLLSLKYSYKEFRQNYFGTEHKNVINYKAECESILNDLFNLLVTDPSISDIVYQYWVNLNGINTYFSESIENKFISNGDQIGIHLLDSLKLKKQLLIKHFEQNNRQDIDFRFKQISLEDEVRNLERELNYISQQYANLYSEISIQNIAKNLSSQESFVDIIRVPYFSFDTNRWTDSVRYLVYIADNTSDGLNYFFINIGKDLENEFISHYRSFTIGNNKTTGRKDELSYHYFWKPIADKLGDAETIYISLGGVYNNINLNTLYNPETGKYLIEEKDIRIVNSARDFVLMKEREKKIYSNNTAALFGYPNYDGQSSISGDSIDFVASTRDLDPLWIDSLTRGGMTASLLPATKTEVENISSTFSNHNWQVTSYLEEDASEKNIKQLKSPRVLHIATHGYFFEDIPIDYNNDRFMGMDRQQVIQDPMLRSGLLFTGANKTLQGEYTSGENGLLSAYEAALLDLSETELVVLSACETGRGEIKNSEGVYGLRKAISDAGAANTIMSLWKVDDKVTQEFMSTFYKEWLSGLTIREAFRKTQLTIKEKYPQPYYWGAFVLVGE